VSETNQRSEPGPAAQGADVPGVATSAGGNGPAGDIPEALAAAQSKAQENWNSYMRAVAELENYRKRAEREVDQARKYAIERFAQELLPVGDALEAGIRSGSANPTVLLEGAQATLKELNRAFDKAGIKILDPTGQSFDPNWHEAMVAQESRDVPPNTVLTVIQKGYSLNGRLLRPARVIVSKAAADTN
jgi:molecular chaperone GrpE